MKKTFHDDAVLTIRMKNSEHAELKKVARKLDLGVAEIARRALRLGLSQLRTARLPGGSVRSITSGTDA